MNRTGIDSAVRVGVPTPVGRASGAARRRAASGRTHTEQQRKDDDHHADPGNGGRIAAEQHQRTHHTKAGTQHQFVAYRLKGQASKPVSMTGTPVQPDENNLADEE